VTALAKGLTALTVLDLGMNDKLTNAGMMALAHLTALTDLDLQHCDRVTDEGMRNISKLSSLTSLNLADCTRLSIESVDSLSFLTNLTHLDLSSRYRPDPMQTNEGDITNEGIRKALGPLLTSLTSLTWPSDGYIDY